MLPLFWPLSLPCWYFVVYTWAWHTRTSLSQVLVVAGLGMLPILPKHLADRACKLSLLGTVLSSGYALYSTYGVNTCLPEPWMVHLILVVLFFPDDRVDLILLFFLHEETKSIEHACNSGLVAVGTWSQGLYPFDVLCVACHISAAFKEWDTVFLLHVHDCNLCVLLLLHYVYKLCCFFFTVAALPVFCWALDHVARFLRRNFAHSSFYR